MVSIYKTHLLTLLTFTMHFSTFGTVEINDISNLNATQVARIERPKNIAELMAAVEQAKKDGLKISMAGKKHSQGGQTFYENAVVVDINNLNAITNLDTSNKIITVQSGVTWQQIQQFCNPH